MSDKPDPAKPETPSAETPDSETPDEAVVSRPSDDRYATETAAARQDDTDPPVHKTK